MFSIVFLDMNVIFCGIMRYNEYVYIYNGILWRNNRTKYKREHHIAILNANQ